MAAPLLSLQRVVGTQSARRIVVHRASRLAPATLAIAKGVIALDGQQFIEELSDARK